jgi:hypothetical protein
MNYLPYCDGPADLSSMSTQRRKVTVDDSIESVIGTVGHEYAEHRVYYNLAVLT